MVHFIGTVRKYGGSHVVTIPSDYIKNNLLESEKTYKFIFEEVAE